MKKALLLLIPTLLTISACSSKGTAGSGSTTSTTSGTIERQYEDITISVTVSGIDAYENGHSFIYLNADALGSSSNWGTAKMTQDTENPNLWTTVIENFQLEQSISYNFYYGGETTPDWTNGKNVIEDADYYTLVTELDVTTYALSAEFNVPDVAGYVDIEFIVEPRVMLTADSEPEELNEGVYVWAWNNVYNDTRVLTKNADGTWSFIAEDVPLLDGVATVQITPVLGTESGTDWTYQIGAWENGTWSKWGNGISNDFTEEQPEHTYSYIYFNGQPSVA